MERARREGREAKTGETAGLFGCMNYIGWDGMDHHPIPNLLGGRRVGGGELRVGRGPDSLYAAASADEEGRGGQSHKGHKQCVLDEVLSGFVCVEVFQ